MKAGMGMGTSIYPLFDEDGDEAKV